MYLEMRCSQEPPYKLWVAEGGQRRTLGSAGWTHTFKTCCGQGWWKRCSIIHSEESQWLSRKTTVVMCCQICVLLNVTTSNFTCLF